MRCLSNNSSDNDNNFEDFIVVNEANVSTEHLKSKKIWVGLALEAVSTGKSPVNIGTAQKLIKTVSFQS